MSGWWFAASAQVGDAVHERDRLGEVREAELALERSVDDRPAGGVPFGHTASMHGRPTPQTDRPAPCVSAFGHRSKGAPCVGRLPSLSPWLLAVVAVGSAQGSPRRRRPARTLSGTVGPGFTISMSKRSVKAGKYRITIRDKSSIHNFHLRGPGAQQDDLRRPRPARRRGTVTLKKGTYRFVCDPHATSMKGTLKVT